MKSKMYLLIVYLIFVTSIFAQPPFISHRGTVYDGTTLKSNWNIKIQISILDNNEITGNIIYQETHETYTNAFGQYSIKIGNGTPTNTGYVFNNINWGQNTKYLKVEIALPTLATDTTYPAYSINGSNQMMSVPYALFSKSSSNGFETVENIEALRNYSSYSDDKIIYVKGYYTLGDGGEGFFTYESDESISDNEGIFIKPNSISGNGRWIRKYSGHMNVAYFGVMRDWDKPSPPLTNSVRIQKMIDYVSENVTGPNMSKEGDLTIYFPSGQYFIESPIVLKSRIKFLGTPATFLTNLNSQYEYMFETGEGVIDKLIVENFIINLNNQTNAGGIRVNTNRSNHMAKAGLQESTFKNILIINNEGNGICLTGTEYNSNADLPNQFNVFENVGASRRNNNTYALYLTGQNANLNFINCQFVNDSQADGTCIFIGSAYSDTNQLKFGAAALNFLNCGFGIYSRYGAIIKDSSNITFDSCFFEGTDYAFIIENCQGISIINSRFANAAGTGSGPVAQYSHTNHVGSCFDIKNSIVNIENNTINVTDPNSTYLDTQHFISGSNSTIDAKNNWFQTEKLARTFGIMNVISINSGNLTIGTKKLIFATVPSNTTTQVNRINSEIIAGETFFVRANQGSIKFIAMDPAGITGKNIFLNGRLSLTLLNGQAATFIKIDNIVGNENATYQLVSISN